MGIFAGSGVGKSVLLSMLGALHRSRCGGDRPLSASADARCRKFLQDDLGPEGLARSVVVVATSDEPALMRRNAAYLTLSLAEYFRDHRQIGAVHDRFQSPVSPWPSAISASPAGSPPTAKGYTPTVFSELPRLLEAGRAGRGARAQSQASSPCWSRGAGLITKRAGRRCGTRASSTATS